MTEYDSTRRSEFRLVGRSTSDRRPVLSCSTVERALFDAPEALGAPIREHFARCGRCRREQRERLRVTTNRPPVSDPLFTSAVMSQIRMELAPVRRERRRSSRRIAAALVFAILVGVVVGASAGLGALGPQIAKWMSPGSARDPEPAAGSDHVVRAARLDADADDESLLSLRRDASDRPPLIYDPSEFGRPNVCDYIPIRPIPEDQPEVLTF